MSGSTGSDNESGLRETYSEWRDQARGKAAQAKRDAAAATSPSAKRIHLQTAANFDSQADGYQRMIDASLRRTGQQPTGDSPTPKPATRPPEQGSHGYSDDDIKNRNDSIGGTNIREGSFLSRYPSGSNNVFLFLLYAVIAGFMVLGELIMKAWRFLSEKPSSDD